MNTVPGAVHHSCAEVGEVMGYSTGNKVSVMVHPLYHSDLLMTHNKSTLSLTLKGSGQLQAVLKKKKLSTGESVEHSSPAVVAPKPLLIFIISFPKPSNQRWSGLLVLRV